LINRLTLPLICFTSLFYLSIAQASPWANPGDSSLRSDIEILAKFDLISGPVNVWPMSWKQITRNLYKADAMTLPPFVTAALRRVQAKIPTEINVRAKAYISNEAEFFRGFQEKGRSKYSAETTLEYNSENTTFHINGEYNDDGNGNSDANLDGSYLSHDLGNWSMYIGSVERWWGPGRETTSILSTNARPMPSVGIRRVEPKPFQTKWLSWMGPWSAELFVGKMDKNRHIPEPIFVGMRLNFEPIENFEVGLSRSLMLCGKDRPCGTKQWINGLIAIGDLDNTGPVAEQPGNQIAQIDLSYSFSLNDNVNLKLYAEGAAEDIHIVFPFRYSRLIGASIFGPIGDNGDQFRLTAEYTDTFGSLAWFFGENKKGVIYNHFIYHDGYRFYNQSIGQNLDSNSQSFSVNATLAKASGIVFNIKYKNMLINSENSIQNRLSVSREKINSVTLGAQIQTQIGRFTLNGRVMDNDINTPLQNEYNFRGGLIWEISF
jgi:hypothetical protein